MMSQHTVDLRNFARRPVRPFPITEERHSVDPQGRRMAFTTYYMTLDTQPWYGVSGEFHFSRMDDARWAVELAKMKAGGINTVSTYVFWNHHEEHEGHWNFEGRRNLRRFIELCARSGMYVIVRLGPFNHGEARNGGLPDWLYGKPYEVRSMDEGFLGKVRELYAQVARQMDGLYFKNGGPVIAAQLDNEYMHSGAPWEMTTGVSNEWVGTGRDGLEYIETLRGIAKESGIDVPFYTCTGWGGAATPDNVLPLWGGYAYRPWLFYDVTGEHPLTDEYLYRDFHANDCPRGEEFDPSYDPEDKPYACCEMGGGMMCSYNYRFSLPMRSVDAMANIKMGSGCNFLGYYMFHGGTNPVGDGIYLNESQVPKASYDYQAAIGEFGRERESYRRLKTLHYFTRAFARLLCPLDVVVPQGQGDINPSDDHTLRWTLRTDGRRGFVFLNNFQDHAVMQDRHDQTLDIALADGSSVRFDDVGLADEENCILPFNMDLDGLLLVSATAQPVTVIRCPGAARSTFVFMRPDGMDSCLFRFSNGLNHRVPDDVDRERFVVDDGDSSVEIIVVSRALADHMVVLDDVALVFMRSDDAIFQMDGRVWIESTSNRTGVSVYPATWHEAIPRDGDWLGEIDMQTVAISPRVDVCEVGDARYAITVEGLDAFDDVGGVADIRLDIRYAGDIGWLFCGNELVSDNFCNGDPWEIGLADIADRLRAQHNALALTITALKQGAIVNVDSAMAARREDVDKRMAELMEVSAQPVYRFAW